MNKNTLNPGLTLRWPHPYLIPIEWSKEAVIECQPSSTGGTVHPGLAVGIGWRWEKSSSAEGIMLNSRRELMTKTLEGTEAERQTPGP